MGLFVIAIWFRDIASGQIGGQNSDDPFLDLLILWLFNGLLFGVVQISYVVLQTGPDDR